MLCGVTVTRQGECSLRRSLFPWCLLLAGVPRRGLEDLDSHAHLGSTKFLGLWGTSEKPARLRLPQGGNQALLDGPSSHCSPSHLRALITAPSRLVSRASHPQSLQWAQGSERALSQRGGCREDFCVPPGWLLGGGTERRGASASPGGSWLLSDGHFLPCRVPPVEMKLRNKIQPCSSKPAFASLLR